MSESPWLEVARRAAIYETPFYLLWLQPLADSLKRLEGALSVELKPKVKHWYSYKTLPVPRVAVEARSLGLGIEVVSRFELSAALRLGFPADQVLVNGVAKHAWLDEQVNSLNVIFDSATEIARLGALAKQLGWRTGLRLAVSNQRDPDNPAYSAQFGVDAGEFSRASAALSSQGNSVDILHFHLRSSVPSVADYVQAVAELRAMADATRTSPIVVDVGGGLTDEIIGNPSIADSVLGLAEYAAMVVDCARSFPNCEEVWLENGRYLVGNAGVLVVTVRDVKRIGDARFLICDGGRTNHALESDWTEHDVLPLSDRGGSGDVEPTVICGPTCMAYDWFFRGDFPSSVRIGDRLIYLKAGAYHIPWETRFSHGTCRVLWTEDGLRIDEIRAPETAEHWFATWKQR